MIKKIALSITVALMAVFFVVPLVMADCCLPSCPFPDQCENPQHQFQCRSRASKGCVYGTGTMKYKSPEYITTYLYAKDPVTWDVIGYPTGGAAMLKYLPEGTEFHFMLTAVGLTPGQNYSLIYYPDPWPGNGLICLGSGTACSQAGCEGKLHMQTANPEAGNYVTPVDTGDLPSGGDQNTGAKIWLVLSEDVGNCLADHMTAWNPGAYLFENSLIYFADTDD